MTLDVGQVVDRYTVVGLLGSGGMADVYEVRHNLLRSTHALKVLRTRDPAVADRLVMEGRVQAALRHPHVVTVTDLVDANNAPGLVMELVRGPTLHEWLAHGDVDLAEAAALGRDIAEGVLAAHRAGVVHRDLKPANVLLDTSSHRVLAKVADFGLVETVGSGRSRLAGSPAYMAPEQARGDAHQDHRVDLFTLGAVLYELFTGERAYRGNNAALLRRLGAGEQPDFHPVPAAVRGLVEGLMRAEAAERITLHEALAPLAALAADTTALASRIGRHAPTLDLDAPTTEASQETLDFDDLEPELPALVGLPEGVRLIGREVDLAELERLLDQASLVSVLGPGGTGKTQMALTAAHDARQRGLSAVFVDLSKCRDAAAVRATVAHQLECPEARIERVLERRAPIRVVLDNAEQVVGPVATLAQAWARIRGVQLLVTTRERLRVSAEQVLDLGPLSRRAAVALFEARARAAGARIDRDDAALIESIVDGLDRLPLPIELAASRARALPLPRLLERLSDRLRLLSGAQRSLRAVLDSSWELLGPSEREALVQCAVFEGPFTLEHAEVVVQVDGEAWVDDLLAELADKSLLRRVDDRWTMFQTIREYALARGLDEAVITRHGACFAQRVRRATDGLEPPTDVAGLKEVATDLADLREIATDTSRAPEHRGWAVCGLFAMGQVPSHSPLIGVCRALGPRVDPVLAERLAYWVAYAAFKRGETNHAAELATPLRDASAPVSVRALRLLGRVAARRGDLEEADATLRECETEARALDDEGLLVDLSIALGVSAWERGDLGEARTALEAAQRKVANRDPAREMRVVHNLGVLLHETEHASLALPLYARARELNATVGDTEFGAMSATTTAIAYADLGQLEQAEALYAEAIAANAACGRVVGEAIAEGNRGNTLLELGRVDEARSLLARACRRARATGDDRVAAYFEATLALEAALDGHIPEADAKAEWCIAVLDRAADARGAALSRVWHAVVALHDRRADDALARLGDPLPDDPGYASLRQLIEDEARRQRDGTAPRPAGGPETMERRLLERHLAAIRSHDPQHG